MITTILLFVVYLFLIVIGLVGVDIINRKISSRTISQRKTIAMLMSLVAYALFIVSLYFMLSYSGIFDTSVWFWTFAIFTFVFLPISIALIVASYLMYFKEVRLKPAVVLIVSLLIFSFAASSLHDIIWCAHATDFYTTPKQGAYDLEIWSEVFGMPNDYRFFGVYMGGIFLLLIYLGITFVDSFLTNVNKKYLFSGVLWLGLFLYFVDSFFRFGRLAVVASLAAFLPLSIYSFIKAFDNPS
ncbi:MAG: hypothetical protein J7K73_02995 [Nanoarchaeota archaeon]|nr:hypothetical protein [Nanoarchaeota archaeon]